MQRQNAICIIPARAGSKGILNKNLVECGGKPLIHWCIMAALDSGCFRDVLVSSDSPEILGYALQCGALSQIRPSHLATDASPVMATMQYVLNKIGHSYDYVQLLQAVTPLVEPSHIQDGFNILLETKADAVVSVCQSTEGLGISKWLPKSHSMRNFLPVSYRKKPRQRLAKRYHLNNCIFVGKSHVFTDGLDFYGPTVKTFGYVMPKEVSIDIDDEHDLFVADALLRRKHGKADTSPKKSFWRHLRSVYFWRR